MVTNDAVRLLGRMRREGTRGLAQRAVRQAYSRLGAEALGFPLLPTEICDSAAVRLNAPPRLPGRRSLRVGWVTTPPSPGSGGHTTMFRMISALEHAGHECRVLLYDRHRGAHDSRVRVIREGWPWVNAEVVNFSDGLDGLDACVATGWWTAHVMARTSASVHPFYFIQDYEPFFYPHGYEYELAADTYRFGFTNIALGSMVQRRLSTELGVDSVMVPFSCDSDVYRLRNTGPRSGVVCYVKPGVPRRGYNLVSQALALFNKENPGVPIHVYGDSTHLTIPVTRHDRLSPQQLNTLYNQSIAGLAMSFTNISLVAEEMLAAGVIPIVNDSADARADLGHPAVVWSRPTPEAVSRALSDVVRKGNQQARAAAAGVRADAWRRTGAEVVRIIESQVFPETARQVAAESAVGRSTSIRARAPGDGRST